jgi:hypothetical protein
MFLPLSEMVYTLCNYDEFYQNNFSSSRQMK